MEDKKEEIIKCLEKAAELLKGPGSSHTEAAVAPPNFRYSHLPVNLNHRNQQSVRNLFRPYSNGGRNVISYWSHKFLCLWSKDSDTVPSKEEKKLLFEAGLGEKKITFVKNNTPKDFTKKLEENYPKMKFEKHPPFFTNRSQNSFDRCGAITQYRQFNAHQQGKAVDTFDFGEMHGEESAERQCCDDDGSMEVEDNISSDATTEEKDSQEVM
uniref:Uncharacterized protein LOC111116475 n=1 Tax=Crassostrea virginica TaxID=6565 RepID=A0A8B8C6D9_CRAVI|nr:uncharacterized protein LOC111116475 [Crassostrea virginica]